MARGQGSWGRLGAWSRHSEVPLLLSLVSTVQQNESAISIYTYPLLFELSSHAVHRRALS